MTMMVFRKVKESLKMKNSLVMKTSPIIKEKLILMVDILVLAILIVNIHVEDKIKYLKFSKWSNLDDLQYTHQLIEQLSHDPLFHR
jgi:hypothetical protein